MLDEKWVPIGFVFSFVTPAQSVFQSVQIFVKLFWLTEVHFAKIIPLDPMWWSVFWRIFTGESPRRVIPSRVIHEKVFWNKDPQIKEPENPPWQLLNILFWILIVSTFSATIHSELGAERLEFNTCILWSTEAPLILIADDPEELILSPSRII